MPANSPQAVKNLIRKDTRTAAATLSLEDRTRIEANKLAARHQHAQKAVHDSSSAALKGKSDATASAASPAASLAAAKKTSGKK